MRRVKWNLFRIFWEKIFWNSFLHHLTHMIISLANRNIWNIRTRSILINIIAIYTRWNFIPSHFLHHKKIWRQNWSHFSRQMGFSQKSAIRSKNLIVFDEILFFETDKFFFIFLSSLARVDQIYYEWTTMVYKSIERLLSTHLWQ